MNARTLVWSGALGAALSVLGCGLTLDYGPPSTMDGGHGDANNGCSSDCDDGLRCTADVCALGTCQHNDTCPGNTECVSRNGVGECRRACTSADACDDGISCTVDACDPADGHCSHTSNCPPGRDACLDTGACAPSHCSNDADCDDGNLCNGSERCASHVCRGGTPVRCADGHGCVTNECDPNTGTCTAVLDASVCADGFSCTTDVCNADGNCTNPPDNTACADADLCSISMCNPTASTDASGCAITSRTTCPDACSAHGVCDGATGMCTYTSACPAGQTCRADGCHATGSCSTSAECAGVMTPQHCQTACISGTCQAMTCAQPPVGSCSRLVLDTNNCPAGGHCSYVADNSLCTDTDLVSTDTCDPGTFTCMHTCPTSPNDCVSLSYVGGRCVPTFDSSYCASVHAGPGTSCVRSSCVGHDAAAGAGPDGCAPRGIDALCTDGAGCTVDTCQVQTGGLGNCTHAVRSDVATYCSDAMECTTDACDPTHIDPMDLSGTGCTHTPNDDVCARAAGTLMCATAFCAQTGSLGNMLGSRVLPTGCAVDYRPNDCGLLPTTMCTLDGQCAMVPCTGGTTGSCDDGVVCNGTEICVAGHCIQTGLRSICVGSSCPSYCTPNGCVSPQTPMCGVTAALN